MTRGLDMKPLSGFSDVALLRRNHDCLNRPSESSVEGLLGISPSCTVGLRHAESDYPTA
jgi:hypothetical protein